MSAGHASRLPGERAECVVVGEMRVDDVVLLTADQSRKRNHISQDVNPVVITIEPDGGGGGNTEASCGFFKLGGRGIRPVSDKHVVPAKDQSPRQFEDRFGRPGLAAVAKEMEHLHEFSSPGSGESVSAYGAPMGSAKMRAQSSGITREPTHQERNRELQFDCASGGHAAIAAIPFELGFVVEGFFGPLLHRTMMNSDDCGELIGDQAAKKIEEPGKLILEWFGWLAEEDDDGHAFILVHAGE